MSTFIFYAIVYQLLFSTLAFVSFKVDSGDARKLLFSTDLASLLLTWIIPVTYMTRLFVFLFCQFQMSRCQKFSLCRYLVWCDKVQIYCEKQQFKMLTVFSPILMADIAISFVFNFISPLSKYFLIKGQ